MVVGAVGVRRPVGNIAYEANVACCPEVLPFVDPNPCHNGLQRMALLDGLCADESKVDCSLQGMLALFSAHADPVGMCQHGPELHSYAGFFMFPGNSNSSGMSRAAIPVRGTSSMLLSNEGRAPMKFWQRIFGKKEHESESGTTASPSSGDSPAPASSHAVTAAQSLATG